MFQITQRVHELTRRRGTVVGKPLKIDQPGIDAERFFHFRATNIGPNRFHQARTVS